MTTPLSTAFTWTAVHHDGQGSVRGVTNAAGARVERTIYRPYGNWASNLTSQFPGAGPVESRGYIGERLDADAGLPQNLSTRLTEILKPPDSNGLHVFSRVKSM